MVQSSPHTDGKHQPSRSLTRKQLLARQPLPLGYSWTSLCSLRHGKVKGIERFLGTVETLDQAMMEVSSGQAKYEHHHKAIVWRMSRLPKEGQGKFIPSQARFLPR